MILRCLNSRKHLCFLVFKGCCSGHPPTHLAVTPPPSLPPPPAGSDQKPVFFSGCRSFAQLKKLFLWKDRALFGACITQFELGAVRDPDTRVSRVPLLYTCFLRLLQGSTGKTGVLAKNPVFQAGNRVSGFGNVPASCENHAWATHGTSCSSPPKVGCVW